MKKWMLQFMLAVAVFAAGLGLFPKPAAATLNSPPSAELITPAPAVVPAAESDFTDVAFEQADQPELGTLAGGDGVGLVLFILFVVLLVLLILWLLNSGSGGHASIEIRDGPGGHPGHSGHHPHGR